MPELPANRRGAGGQLPRPGVAWTHSPSAAAHGRCKHCPSTGHAPAIAPTGPLRWQLFAWSTSGGTLLDVPVLGQPELSRELAALEERSDFGGSIALPL